MSLTGLAVRNFRNLRCVDLEPARINVIHGDNAAGKTSLLEAVHFLARARSFRSSRPEQLVRRGADGLLVRGEVALREGGSVRAGIARQERRTRVRINGEEVRSLSRLAFYFPVEVINSESQRLLLDGPAVRRSFLNWGMFHVEHGYQDAWQRYDRALRQRNAALRARDRRLAAAWEAELAQSGELIGDARERFINELGLSTGELFQAWLPEEAVELRHRPGWDRAKGLAAGLAEGRDRDLELGYTVQGPQRADLVVRSQGVEAQHRLSRGQQKVAVMALILALARLQAEHAPTAPILLVDDLPAELDAGRRAEVMAALEASGSQCFITCIDPAQVPVSLPDRRLFHVEHGSYHEVI